LGEAEGAGLLTRSRKNRVRRSIRPSLTQYNTKNAVLKSQANDLGQEMQRREA
jgi:hypothetical protein